MTLPTDPEKLILTDADITRPGPLQAAFEGVVEEARMIGNNSAELLAAHRESSTPHPAYDEIAESRR